MKRDDLREVFAKKATTDAGFAIAWALIDLADAQEATAKAIQRLGNGDAATHLGAIENLAVQVQGVTEALNSIASGVVDIAHSRPGSESE